MTGMPGTVVRRGMSIAWVVLVVLLLFLILLANIVPHFGRTPFIVRGGSMEPAIPIGALIAVAPVAAEDLRVGDIITLRHGATQILTHRIVGIDSPDGQIHIRTRGDANQTADPGDHQASDVLGRVDWYIPIVGFVLAFLSAPAGMVSMITFLGAFLMAIWLMEERGWGRQLRRMAPRGTPGEAPA